jgi:hypothetical protein
MIAAGCARECQVQRSKSKASYFKVGGYLSNRLYALVVLTAVVFAHSALADKIRVTLSGASQVPPNTSAGFGNAEIDYDPATKIMRWKVTHSGLAGVTSAYFHGPADAGKTGHPDIPILDAATSPAEGSVTLTDKQVGYLLAGKYYVNVHTYKYPGGEVRGQVLVGNDNPHPWPVRQR